MGAGGGFVAHFLPMQFLAPMENGCTTSRWSFAKCSLPSQREGAKMSGELKFRREWLAAYWLSWTPCWRGGTWYSVFSFRRLGAEGLDLHRQARNAH